MVLNLWQKQHQLSAKRHQHTNSGGMSGSRSTPTMEQPRLPNRTITMRDDADVTPIISHQHRHHHRTPSPSSINNCPDKRTHDTNSDINVTCDNCCNHYSNEENIVLDKKQWTFSAAIPVKLKLLSKFIRHELSVYDDDAQNVNDKDDTSDIDRNIDSDFQIGKCKKINVKTTRDSRGSVYRKTIFWQCCLIFMYIFLLNLSTSTCFAARQEGELCF